MVLNVAHGVQRELSRSDIEPFESTALPHLLAGECLDHYPTLLAATLETGTKFIFDIHPFREYPRWVQLRDGRWPASVKQR